MHAPSAARAGLPPLIPRDQLLPRPPARQALRLSPDGRVLSYVAADPAGTSQVWLQDLEEGILRQLTRPSPGGLVRLGREAKLICYEQKQPTKSRLVKIETNPAKSAC
jgi:Tol biopolymer transport system component